MKMKKWISIFSIFSLTLAFPLSLSSFAADDELSASMSKVRNLIQYEAEADPTCTWDDRTTVADITRLYNLDDQEIGYIFNLKTGQENTGYVLVNTENATPDIFEYGYDDEYYLTDENQFPHLKDEKLCYLGLRNFVYGESEQYYAAETGEKLEVSKSELKALSQSLKSPFHSIMSEQRAPAATNQVIYESVNVPNLWANSNYSRNFIPYIMNDFEGYINHCGPTCGMNMLKYWYNRRSINGLLVNNERMASMQALADAMEYTPTFGTIYQNAYEGMEKYLENFCLSMCAGMDIRTNYSSPGYDWAYIKQQIQNGNVMYISLVKDSSHSYNNHAVLCVGYQDTSDGQYLRIADGWTRSLSTFVKYTYTNMQGLWYYRW